VQESLQLENPRAGRYRLTRTLALPDGLQSTLLVDGPDSAAVLAAMEAIEPQRQFFTEAGCLVALDQHLTLRASGGTQDAAPRLTLSNATAQVAGLTLKLRVPGVTGVPAEVELATAPGDTIELPDDLLAVLGWPWSRLQRARQGWTGVLRLSGKDEGVHGTRSADALLRLRATVAHLARTLAEPPAHFHQRLKRQRWGVTLRRAVPLLTGIGLLLGAAAVPKIDLAEDSVLRMLIFHAPPLLLVVFFCLREMPRIEIPPRPRAPATAHWRESPPSAPEQAHATP
jgi:hypothetical protein